MNNEWLLEILPVYVRIVKDAAYMPVIINYSWWRNLFYFCINGKVGCELIELMRLILQFILYLVCSGFGPCFSILILLMVGRPQEWKFPLSQSFFWCLFVLLYFILLFYCCLRWKLKFLFNKFLSSQILLLFIF